MKFNTIISTTLLLLLLQSISVAAFSQSMCYSACTAFSATCFWVAGAPSRAMSYRIIAASPTYSACNGALSECMRTCVDAAEESQSTSLMDTFSRSICYSGCTAFSATCFWVAGAPRRHLSHRVIAASPVYSACNAAISACMSKCADAAWYNDDDSYYSDSDSYCDSDSD